jgi:tRNA A37 threonylcarbamoyladenosine modification protein TsaB
VPDINCKGLAFGLDRKVIPIDNFALNLNRIKETDPGKKYCVLIPAKLPEYYWAQIQNSITIDSGCTIFENIAKIIEKDTIIVGDFDDDSLIKHYYFEYINVKNLKSELDSMLELTQKHCDSAKEAEEIEPLYLKDFSLKKHSRNS